MALASASAAGRSAGSEIGRETATVRPRNRPIRSASPSAPGSSAAAASDGPELETRRVAAEDEPARRREEAELTAKLLALRVERWHRRPADAWSGEEDDPRRTPDRQDVAPAGHVAGPADGLVASELEGEERRDPLRDDPLELADRALAEQGEAARAAAGRATTLLAGTLILTARAGRAERVDDAARGDRGGGADGTPRASAIDPTRRRRREAHPEGHGARPGEVRLDRGRRPGHVRGGVDGERVAASAFKRDRPAEPGADRPDQPGQIAALERERLEPGLEEGRLPVELGPPIHEEADRAPLDRDGIEPWRPERRKAGGRRRGPQRVEGCLASGLALDEEQPGDPRPDELADECRRLRRSRRNGRQGPGRDDREVARIERVERRNPRLEDPGPADLTGPRRVVERGDRHGRREERGPQVGEGRHRSGAALSRARGRRHRRRCQKHPRHSRHPQHRHRDAGPRPGRRAVARTPGSKST